MDPEPVFAAEPARTSPAGWASGWADTRLGRFFVGATDHGLALVCLDAAGVPERLEDWRRRSRKIGPQRATSSGARACSVAGGAEDVVALSIEQLREYADGRRREFDLTLDLRGTEFQRAVWRAERAVAFGGTRTYAEIASAVERPRAVRAVGRATGANPVPIVVPCHRVLAKGGLGGFTGGLDHKRRLLRHEGTLLFD